MIPEESQAYDAVLTTVRYAATLWVAGETRPAHDALVAALRDAPAAGLCPACACFAFMDACHPAAKH